MLGIGQITEAPPFIGTYDLENLTHLKLFDERVNTKFIILVNDSVQTSHSRSTFSTALKIIFLKLQGLINFSIKKTLGMVS